jgi:hypothetical protein
LRFLPEAEHGSRIRHIKLRGEAFNLSAAFFGGGNDVGHE